jgi:hypothetical protein
MNDTFIFVVGLIPTIAVLGPYLYILLVQEKSKTEE